MQFQQCFPEMIYLTPLCLNCPSWVDNVDRDGGMLREYKIFNFLCADFRKGLLLATVPNLSQEQLLWPLVQSRVISGRESVL